MSKAFDPDNFRVEELFNAKEERRQHLAKLPFEDKIKIVNRLHAGVSALMKNEKLIFESFLKACPDFANEPIEEWDVVEDWYNKRALDPPPQPLDKRPDIIALTASGRRIGVELKSWVNREQIAKARKQESIQDNILKAIGKQPPNKTENIGCVWLFARRIIFNPKDAPQLQAQLFARIEQVDQSWTKKPKRDQNSWEDISDFPGFPILEKYLESARFFTKSRRHLDARWILFPSRANHYSPDTMRETLRIALLAHKNDIRYEDLKHRVGLDEVYLLLHYDFKAFAYNTHFAAPRFGFTEAADLASSELGGDGGYFDRIFLFHFLWGKEEAKRIL
jgi:hypothetical protein